MKVRHVFLLSLFVVLAVNAWTLDLRAIAYRAFSYLGSPLPEKVKVIDGIGWIVDNKNGDYEESWGFQFDTNQIVKTANYIVYDSNRNKLNNILIDFEAQIYIQGYIFFGADEVCNVYVTKDGPFSMLIVISNSIKTFKSGKIGVQITFMRLADAM
jgi:hypothetical protein